MPGSVHRENLAARAGRWSARHWKTAVFGWLGFVFAAFALGNLVGTNSLSVNEPGPGESGRVQQILNDEFEQPAKELVLVQSSSLTARSPQFNAAVDDVIRRLQAQPNVTNVESPFATGNPGRVSSDGRSALVAAGIPLLLALTSVLATIGLLALPSKGLPMDDSVNAVVLLIGLAVGVDYSMFYLKREREGVRPDGRSPLRSRLRRRRRAARS